MSKTILIIYPHFPPSNLAGVHRPRLFAQHLPFFGWTPVVLTVHENYFEEMPDCPGASGVSALTAPLSKKERG